MQGWSQKVDWSGSSQHLQPDWPPQLIWQVTACGAESCTIQASPLVNHTVPQASVGVDMSCQTLQISTCTLTFKILSTLIWQTLFTSTWMLNVDINSTEIYTAQSRKHLTVHRWSWLYSIITAHSLKKNISMILCVKARDSVPIKVSWLRNYLRFRDKNRIRHQFLCLHHMHMFVWIYDQATVFNENKTVRFTVPALANLAP